MMTTFFFAAAKADEAANFVRSHLVLVDVNAELHCLLSRRIIKASGSSADGDALLILLVKDE